MPKVPQGSTQILGTSKLLPQFIKDFSLIYLLLTALTSDSVPYVWDQIFQQAFNTLKEAFTSAPILAMADPSKP